jgi:hypothetical protein
MYPHRIRLRGPWEYEVLDVPGGGAPSAGRVTMPCLRWEGPMGHVRLRRRFGYPGQVDSYERVWVVFDGLASSVQLSVNGTDLGMHSVTAEVDVTQLLGARNELTLEIPDMAPGKGLWDEAALEVRCTAYLRNVQVKRIGDEIRATGEVVGTAEGPLELYLVADRSPAGYSRVDPAGGVQPFELRGPGTNEEGKPVGQAAIELVQGAVAWYRVERAVPE